MSKVKRLTPPEVALMLGVCNQRIGAKLKQGHFPNAELCECGRTTMIPVDDIVHDLQIREHRKK